LPGFVRPRLFIVARIPLTPSAPHCPSGAPITTTTPMKKTLCLATALLSFAFLSPASAGESAFPEKDSILKFEVPAGWKTEADAKSGTTAISSADGRIVVTLAPLPVAATMDLFQAMLPDMLKSLGETTVVDKPNEHTEDGLTGYTGTYATKIEGKSAMCVIVLFKGEKEHAVLGTIIATEPESLPKEDGEAMGAFMKSMKGAAK
jgi:hypothetical protein